MKSEATEVTASWIRTVPEHEAVGEVAEAYRISAGPDGRVPNIVKVHSVAPRVLAAVSGLYRSLAMPAEISALEREAVAVAVSAVNECGYCVHHDGRALRALGAVENILKALEDDPVREPLPARLRAIVDFALKLTLRASRVTEADVSRLRSVGLSDVGVHDVAALAAAFNFSNRMAQGMGVRVET